jgi:VWFA-related protein
MALGTRTGYRRMAYEFCSVPRYARENFLKTITWLFTVVLGLAFLAPAVQLVEAQEAGIHVHLEHADTSAFPQVSISLNAWDAAGLPVRDLSVENILIHEDGGNPVQPLSVAADPKAPLQVALVIDISGSMQGEPLEDAKAAAARFLDRLSPGDQVALIAFSEPVDPDPDALDQARELPFSEELETAYDLVENLQSGGGTHLYHAVTKAVRMASNQPAGHRAVLVLSDGRNDPPSVGEPEEPIRMARDANLPVFVIGLGDFIDEPYLRRLANETGGLYRDAPRSSELARLFDDMATLLKTQYRVTYTSQLPPDGKIHRLRLTVSTQGENIADQIEVGPLPFMATTTSTLAPEKTATPTQTAVPSATPVPVAATEIEQPVPLILTPTPPPSAFSQVLVNPLGWMVFGLVLVGGGLFIFGRRRPKAIPEACARCGFDLTGRSGACPQCGETRRLVKPK